MSHKVKNPIPAKELTMADVTTVEYASWKTMFSVTRICQRFTTVVLSRLKAITIDKDIYIPTRLKQWVEVVDQFGHKHMKKVPAGEGVLKEHNEGEVTISEETYSRKVYKPIND